MEAVCDGGRCGCWSKDGAIAAAYERIRTIHGDPIENLSDFMDRLKKAIADNNENQINLLVNGYTVADDGVRVIVDE